MTEPTDAEIIALADETRTAEGGANGYILPISFCRAVLAKWGTPPAVAGEPLVRQMRDALALPCDRWNATQSRIVREAIDAADAWLEGN